MENDPFGHVLELPVVCFLLFSDRPSLRSSELSSCDFRFSSQVLGSIQIQGYNSVAQFEEYLWIGRMLWYIAKHAMENGFVYIRRQFYRSLCSKFSFTAAVFSYSDFPVPRAPPSPLPFPALSHVSSSHHTPLHA